MFTCFTELIKGQKAGKKEGLIFPRFSLGNSLLV